MKIFHSILTSLLLPLCAEGVIVARSIAPGEVFDGSQIGVLIHNIDLDRDGTVDFFTTTAGNQASIVPTGNNRILSIVATLPDLGRAIAPLLGGETIELVTLSPMSWNGLDDRVNALDDGGAFIYFCNGRVQPGSPPECDSVIPALETRYVGLELEKDGKTHYGWVAINSELSVLQHVNVTAWAYETDPGLSISAGAIPEPSGILLLSLVSILGLLKRSRESIC